MIRTSITSTTQFLSAALLSMLACTAQAGIVRDDAVADFSNDGLAPTALVFTAGANVISGSTGNGGQGIDRDYFSFVVPTGMRLTSIDVLSGTNVSGGASFFAVQIGPQVTTSPTGASADALLGYLHYGNDMIGQDLLPLVAPSHVGGLATGIYSVWVQETGGPATYSFAFNVAPVPVPSAAMLMLSGLGGLAALRRRDFSSPAK